MSRAYRIQGLTTAQKAVLVVLCDHANDEGASCYPSMGRIASHASISERTAYRVVKDLERIGYVKREPVPGRSTQFTIVLDCPHPCQIVTPDKMAGAPDMVAGAPDTVSPYPSYNHQEPSNDMSPDGDETFTFDDFVESWNAVATETGLPVLKAISKSRRTAFRQRQREFPAIADWQAAFRCLRTSKFLRGENDRDWKADADFFLQAKSFPKLVEGSYA
jgi:hypothetical protein